MSKEITKGRDMPNVNWAQDLTGEYPSFMGDPDHNQLVLDISEKRREVQAFLLDPPQDGLLENIEFRQLATEIMQISNRIKALEMKDKISQATKLPLQSQS